MSINQSITNAKQISLDSDVLESIEYMPQATWREIKPESVLITDRMYIKLIFQKKSEINLQGKVFLWKTIFLTLPKDFKLKSVKALNKDEIKTKYVSKEKKEATHKFNSYVCMTDKHKILSFGLILEKDQSLLSLCTEMKRRDTDPAYAMRVKNYLQYTLIAFIILLMLKDAQVLDIDILDMQYWWVYASVFAFFWGMHRESLEAKCWYMATLCLNQYREPIEFSKKDILTTLINLVPKIHRDRNIHLDVETYIIIVWYSAEVSPQTILDLTLDDLQNQIFQSSLAIATSALEEADRYRKQYETAKEQTSTLRAEISRLKQDNRLSLEMGKALASDSFEIKLIEPGEQRSRSSPLQSIDWTKLILVFIMGIVIVALAFFGINFVLVLDLDVFSKVIIFMVALIILAIIFLFIYKGRS